jgi:hypothetical protein
MTTYYETYGQKVQYLASDPAAPEIGQVWYNSTSATLKVRTATTSGTWATSPNLNAISRAGGAAGIKTAALTFGATGTPGSAPTLISQSWNDTVWTTTPSLPRGGDYTSGFGTQTSAVSAGDGRPVGANYSNIWNGTSWTATGNTTQYGYAGVGLGIQTAGMLASRSDGGPQNYVELFNGSTWSDNPADLNTARSNAMASGTQTTALIFGGDGSSTATESYNGTSWTTLSPLNTGRSEGGGSGTQTDSICYGGYAAPSPTGATELWNGTSWTNNPTGMNVARTALNNTLGLASSSLAVGSGPANISVEAWVGAGTAVTNTVTAT